MSKWNRIIFLDYLRCFSIIGVIALHVIGVLFTSIPVNTTDWMVVNLFESIVRWSVPAFLMISGALFLNKNITIKNLYFKYIFRLLIIYLFWSFIYYLFGNGNIYQKFLDLFFSKPINSIVIIISGHYHLWFIPMIIGMYMTIPILKKIIEDEKVLRYFLILSLVFNFVIPQLIQLFYDFLNKDAINLINSFNNFFSNMNLHLFLGYTFYFLLGYYFISYGLNKKLRYVIYFLGFLGVIFTFILTLLISLKSQKAMEVYFWHNRINVLCVAASLFIIFKNHKFSFILSESFIFKMSKYSFGAYLCHPFLIIIFKKMGFYNLFPKYIFINIIFLIVLVSICSFIISAILNKLPFLNKYFV